eukprot:g12134.t2
MTAGRAGSASSASLRFAWQNSPLGIATSASYLICRWKLSAALLAAAVCVSPGPVVAAAGGAMPATANPWVFGAGLAMLVVGGVVAARIWKPSSCPSTKGMTSKTGVAVELPYQGTHRCIYLDYNATSPIFPEVSREMFPFIGECFGNPSSAHALGRACKAAVVKARARVAALLGCSPEEVVFVASGSEADNHAILASLAIHAKSSASSSLPSNGDVVENGASAASPNAPPVQHVVSSAIEHPAITKCLDHLAAEGRVKVTYVGVDGEGRVSVEEVVGALRPDTALVTIMHSNNEVGSLQPIKEIAEACRPRGILCHTDAAQSIGKVPVKVSGLGVDMLTLVGHKFGAPKGVAALFVRRGLALPPMVHGGGQEAGRRAGTENVLLISGMGKAAEIVNVELDQLSKHLAAMRARLLDILLAADLGEGVKVHGPRDPSLRLPNTLSIGIPGVEARVLLERLSETVAASAGSACHAGGATMSGVLQAMGVDEPTGFGTLRLSVGRHTTRKEVDQAGAAIARTAGFGVYEGYGGGRTESNRNVPDLVAAGSPYYVDEATGTTQWEKPLEMDGGAQSEEDEKKVYDPQKEVTDIRNETRASTGESGEDGDETPAVSKTDGSAARGDDAPEALEDGTKAKPSGEVAEVSTEDRIQVGGGDGDPFLQRADSNSTLSTYGGELESLAKYVTGHSTTLDRGSVVEHGLFKNGEGGGESISETVRDTVQSTDTTSESEVETDEENVSMPLKSSTNNSMVERGEPSFGGDGETTSQNDSLARKQQQPIQAGEPAADDGSSNRTQSVDTHHTLDGLVDNCGQQARASPTDGDDGMGEGGSALIGHNKLFEMHGARENGDEQSPSVPAEPDGVEAGRGTRRTEGGQEEAPGQKKLESSSTPSPTSDSGKEGENYFEEASPKTGSVDRLSKEMIPTESPSALPGAGHVQAPPAVSGGKRNESNGMEPVEQIGDGRPLQHTDITVATTPEAKCPSPFDTAAVTLMALERLKAGMQLGRQREASVKLQAHARGWAARRVCSKLAESRETRRREEREAKQRAATTVQSIVRGRAGRFKAQQAKNMRTELERQQAQRETAERTTSSNLEESICQRENESLRDELDQGPAANHRCLEPDKHSDGNFELEMGVPRETSEPVADDRSVCQEKGEHSTEAHEEDSTTEYYDRYDSADLATTRWAEGEPASREAESGVSGHPEQNFCREQGAFPSQLRKLGGTDDRFGTGPLGTIDEEGHQRNEHLWGGTGAVEAEGRVEASPEDGVGSLEGIRTDDVFSPGPSGLARKPEAIQHSPGSSESSDEYFDQESTSGDLRKDADSDERRYGSSSRTSTSLKTAGTATGSASETASGSDSDSQLPFDGVDSYPSHDELPAKSNAEECVDQQQQPLEMTATGHAAGTVAEYHNRNPLPADNGITGHASEEFGDSQDSTVSQTAAEEMDLNTSVPMDRLEELRSLVAAQAQATARATMTAAGTDASKREVLKIRNLADRQAQAATSFREAVRRSIAIDTGNSGTSSSVTSGTSSQKGAVPPIPAEKAEVEGEVSDQPEEVVVHDVGSKHVQDKQAKTRRWNPCNDGDGSSKFPDDVTRAVIDDGTVGDLADPGVSTERAALILASDLSRLASRQEASACELLEVSTSEAAPKAVELDPWKDPRRDVDVPSVLAALGQAVGLQAKVVGLMEEVVVRTVHSRAAPDPATARHVADDIRQLTLVQEQLAYKVQRFVLSTNATLFNDSLNGRGNGANDPTVDCSGAPAATEDGHGAMGEAVVSGATVADIVRNAVATETEAETAKERLGKLATSVVKELRKGVDVGSIAATRAQAIRRYNAGLAARRRRVLGETDQFRARHVGLQLRSGAATDALESVERALDLRLSIRREKRVPPAHVTELLDIVDRYVFSQSQLCEQERLAKPQALDEGETEEIGPQRSRCSICQELLEDLRQKFPVVRDQSSWGDDTNPFCCETCWENSPLPGPPEVALPVGDTYRGGEVNSSRWDPQRPASEEAKRAEASAQAAGASRFGDDEVDQDGEAPTSSSNAAKGGDRSPHAVLSTTLPESAEEDQRAVRSVRGDGVHLEGRSDGLRADLPPAKKAEAVAAAFSTHLRGVDKYPLELARLCRFAQFLTENELLREAYEVVLHILSSFAVVANGSSSSSSNWRVGSFPACAASMSSSPLPIPLSLNAQLLLVAGRLAVAIGRYPEAVRHVKMAVRAATHRSNVAAPESPAILVSSSRVFEYLLDDRSAEVILLGCVLQYPDFKPALSTYGKLAARTGELGVAEKYLTRAASLASGNGTAAQSAEWRKRTAEDWIALSEFYSECWPQSARAADALACFRKALNYLDWRSLEYHSPVPETTTFPSLDITHLEETRAGPPSSSPSTDGLWKPSAAALLGLGRFELLQNRSVKRALSLFKACLNKSPWHASAKVHVAVCLLEQLGPVKSDRSTSRAILRTDSLLRSALESHFDGQPGLFRYSKELFCLDTAAQTENIVPSSPSGSDLISPAPINRSKTGRGAWVLWAFYAKFAERCLRNPRLAMYALDRGVAAASASVLAGIVEDRWKGASSGCSDHDGGKIKRVPLHRGMSAPSLALVARAQFSQRWPKLFADLAGSAVGFNRKGVSSPEEFFMDATKRFSNDPAAHAALGYFLLSSSNRYDVGDSGGLENLDRAIAAFRRSMVVSEAACSLFVPATRGLAVALRRRRLSTGCSCRQHQPSRGAGGTPTYDGEGHQQEEQTTEEVEDPRNLLLSALRECQGGGGNVALLRTVALHLYTWRPSGNRDDDTCPSAAPVSVVKDKVADERQAEMLLARAASLEPFHVPTMAALAFMLLQGSGGVGSERAMTRAERLLEKAIECTGRRVPSDILRTLARIRAYRGRRSSAISLFRRAATSAATIDSPDDPLSLCGLAQLLLAPYRPCRPLQAQASSLPLAGRNGEDCNLNSTAEVPTRPEIDALQSPALTASKNLLPTRVPGSVAKEAVPLVFPSDEEKNEAARLLARAFSSAGGAMPPENVYFGNQVDDAVGVGKPGDDDAAGLARTGEGRDQMALAEVHLVVSGFSLKAGRGGGGSGDGAKEWHLQEAARVAPPDSKAGITSRYILGRQALATGDDRKAEILFLEALDAEPTTFGGCAALLSALSQVAVDAFQAKVRLRRQSRCLEKRHKGQRRGTGGATQKAVSVQFSQKIEVSKRSVKFLERLQEYASLRKRHAGELLRGPALANLDWALALEEGWEARYVRLFEAGDGWAAVHRLQQYKH